MTTIVREEERHLTQGYPADGIRTIVRTDGGKYYAIDTASIGSWTIETMIFSCLDEKHDYEIVDWREHYVEHYKTMDEAIKRHHEIANDFDNVMQSDEFCPLDWREAFSPKGKTEPQRKKGSKTKMSGKIRMSDADGVYYCCSECGEEVQRTWLYCPHCGANIYVRIFVLKGDDDD